MVARKGLEFYPVRFQVLLDLTPDERTVSNYSNDLEVQIQQLTYSLISFIESENAIKIWIDAIKDERVKSTKTTRTQIDQITNSRGKCSPRPMGSIRDQIEFNSVRMRVYLSPTVRRRFSSFFSLKSLSLNTEKRKPMALPGWIDAIFWPQSCGCAANLPFPGSRCRPSWLRGDSVWNKVSASVRIIFHPGNSALTLWKLLS